MNAEARHMREMLKETLNNHKFTLVAAKSNGRRVAIKLTGYAKEECYKEMPTTVGATSHVWSDVDGGLYTWAINHATFIKYVDTLPAVSAQS